MAIVGKRHSGRLAVRSVLAPGAAQQEARWKMDVVVAQSSSASAERVRACVKIAQPLLRAAEGCKQK